MPLDAGDVLELAFHVGGAILEVAGSIPGGGNPAAASALAIPAVSPVRDLAPARLEARALDPHLTDAERLASLHALLANRAHDPSRALVLLLADPSVAVSTAAVEAAGKRRLQGAYAVLVRMRGRTEEESAAIVGALGRIGGVHAEARLLAALDRGEPAAQLAAAKALKHIGTLAAVQPLRVHANSWFAGELGTEAAAAISGIQRRLAKNAPGALSIGGVRGGELSVPADAGALSLRMKQEEQK